MSQAALPNQGDGRACWEGAVRESAVMLVTWMSEKGRTLVRAGLMFVLHVSTFSLLRRSILSARRGIPGSKRYREAVANGSCWQHRCRSPWPDPRRGSSRRPADRKSTRLNSSHSQISYAVFCLKKKKKKEISSSKV